jgi:hypothetical protein
MAGRLPEWIERLPGGDDPPAWLRAKLAAGATGGHRASAAERRAAYAMFAARRNAIRGQAGHPGVFASMRDPDDMSPMARRIFGEPR